MKRSVSILVAGWIGAVAFSGIAVPTASAQEKGAVVITDTTAWNHPVKNVFKTHAVTLKKVELLREGTYPVFTVDLPYDPTVAATNSFFHPLYFELLKANGWWDFALVSELDGIRIEVGWDKAKKTITENIVSLKDAATNQ